MCIDSDQSVYNDDAYHPSILYDMAVFQGYDQETCNQIFREKLYYDYLGKIVTCATTKNKQI